MSFILYWLQTLARKLYPLKSAVFYVALVFIFVVFYRMIILNDLQNNLSINYLLLFLWTLLFYLFINLFGKVNLNKADKIYFWNKIMNKIKHIYFYFFIVFFIVLFFLSAFYTFKILNV